MPLGAGALAGSAFPLDRGFMARELGFSQVAPNSLDAVSDRDFMVECLAALSILMMHLSRFCEDLIIWSSAEFGFVELADAFSTGSSMMPQKKNPDSLELVRGKTGRVYGDLIALLTTMKGLPLTYAKDMQEDKEPCFDALETAAVCLDVFLRGVGIHGTPPRAHARAPWAQMPWRRTWRTTWSGRGLPSEMPTASSAQWCARYRNLTAAWPIWGWKSCASTPMCSIRRRWNFWGPI